MSRHHPDPQMDAIIADYLAGTLSASDRRTFERWLLASPASPAGSRG